MQTISCYAPYGDGGLGRYLEQFVEEARARGELGAYFCKSPKPNDSCGHQVDPALLPSLFQIPPIRYDLGLKDWLGGLLFDRAVASKLNKTDVFHGFNGKSLRSLRRAKELGTKRLILESANSHANNIWRQHRRASRRFGIEHPWLDWRQRERMLQEYELADEIWCASQYSWDSFIEAGISTAKLRRRPFHIHPRFFEVDLAKKGGDDFTLVYVGRIDITKGIPMLRDLMSRFHDPKVKLVLVGGTGSRAMHKYVNHWLRSDARVTMVAGDPVPHLLRADALVHPSFEDGFALAPVEAMACGVPAIVSADTGMKELIQPGVNGFVVPTGDDAQLFAKVNELRDQPLKGQAVRTTVAGQYAAAS